MRPVSNSPKLSEPRKRQLKKFEAICIVLGAERRMNILKHLSINEKASVTDIQESESSMSRRWLQDTLTMMVDEGVLCEHSRSGKRIYYMLNPENSTVMEMTAGFRKRARARRRPSEELLDEVRKHMGSQVQCSRKNLAEALSELGISNSRLSQLIRILIDDGEIERMDAQGSGVSYKLVTS